MRESTCADCGATVVANGPRGPFRKRCDACRRQLRRSKQADYLQRLRGVERTCRDCGERFTVGTQPTTCGRCHSLRTRPGSSEQQRRSLTAARARAIRRAATHCALCGGELDNSAASFAPLAANVDHIIQRSDGGSDDDSNLRVVHRQCNDAWAKTVPHYRLGAARAALWLASRGL